MPKHNPNQSLADILENIERALQYVGTLSFTEFARNEEKVDAVLRRLQNASEASTRLHNEWPEFAAELEARHSDVNWLNFRNLGNRYRHHYDHIDVERVYEDVQAFIPSVRSAVADELPLSKIWLAEHQAPEGS